MSRSSSPKVSFTCGARRAPASMHLAARMAPPASFLAARLCNTLSSPRCSRPAPPEPFARCAVLPASFARRPRSYSPRSRPRQFRRQRPHDATPVTVVPIVSPPPGHRQLGVAPVRVVAVDVALPPPYRRLNLYSGELGIEPVGLVPERGWGRYPPVRPHSSQIGVLREQVLLVLVTIGGTDVPHRPVQLPAQKPLVPHVVAPVVEDQHPIPWPGLFIRGALCHGVAAPLVDASSPHGWTRA